MSNSSPNVIIGIDVETTSLEPAEGEIIEVAAIKYDLETGQELGSFAHLTKPKQPVSDKITAITGITQDMVKDQPPFTKILEELQEFIGDDTVFAHNATFDVNFLTYHGLKLDNNDVWDTFALASIAWPTSPSYNLGMLAGQLGIEVEGEHRAGDDVRMTWQLLLKIRDQLGSSKETNHQIMDLLHKSKQEHYVPLFKVDGKQPPASARPKPKPNHSTLPADSSLPSIFAASGPLAKSLPNYSPRPEQLEMAEAVADNIKQGRVGLIEAGTGTGKTFAYLTPLIQEIINNKSKGGVATYTKNLQDQLINQDIPKLQAALGTNLSTAVLKGRRNYLCQSRLKQALGRKQLKPPEAMLLIKIVLWLEHDGSGDLDHLNTSHLEAGYLLNHLRADSLSCRLSCDIGCPYQAAKAAAEQADLVVINHALLVQLGGPDSALPLANLVVDEAHHLEEVARDATAVDFSEARVAELIAPILKSAQDSSQPAHVEDEAKQLLDDYRILLADIQNFLIHHSSGNRFRLTDSARRSAKWEKIQQQGSNWQSKSQFLVGLISSTKDSTKEKAALTREAIKDLEKFSVELTRFMTGSTERVQWLEFDYKERMAGRDKCLIFDVALSVRPSLQPIFAEANSITLTSATLSTAGGFSYIKARLGLELEGDQGAIKLHSSFDFKQQMLIYIVEDGEHPASHNFDSSTAIHLEQIAKLISGRTLGLFTSHSSVHNVYASSVKALSEANIKLLAQKQTGGRHNIITRFNEVPSTVLLGTYSFWEGVDVPGESLSCVLIPKLPFTPPDDPVMDALAEDGLNTFQDLSLPQMILRLKQGIGRLIRSRQDFGAVVILDGRFLQKNYGQDVLNSLPPARIHIGSKSDLVPTLTDWFGSEKLDQWADEKAN